MATHYRAGEITYQQISLLTYQITAITYTDYTKRPADRPEIEIYFGDGKFETVPRANGDGEIINSTLFNEIKRNIYRTNHTYTGPGKYLISLTDPNRIDQIRNINFGNSVNIPFYVESYLNITAGFGFNQSPILKLPPIDIGCRFRTFKHNPIAYDPDGDSLAFTIIAPKRATGVEVENFEIPAHSDSFSLNVHTGELIWQTPLYNGPYNIAILIREFRKGVLMGFVVRDMQIYINDNCNNTPPQIAPIQDTCVEATQLLQFNITATDINAGQVITIRKYGGPFDQINSPATVTPDPAIGVSPVTTTFKWTPSGNAIRYATHQAGFRATDNDPSNPLSDIKAVNIKVNGPAPKNIQIAQDSNGFILRWNRDTTLLGFGYRIYRRVDSSYWKHNFCEIGVPTYTGFTLLDTTQGVNNTTYFDNQFGKGLSPLIRYCYIITTYYPPRSENGNIIFSEAVESYASIEVCDVIKLTKPAITHVSVTQTSTTNGKIYISWIKPNTLDTVDQFPPPYRVQLQRADYGSNNFGNIGLSKTYASFSDLKDDALTDSLLNTVNTQYVYKVILYCTKNNIERYATESIIASSVKLNNINTNRTVILKWTEDVPWNNHSYVVYKKNALNSFDSIAFTNATTFADTGLYNGVAYCYYVKSIGGYNPVFYPPILYNNSQEICGIPVDTVKPCTPILSVDTPCNSFKVVKVGLNWVYPQNCDKDVVKYLIYWRKNPTENWKIIDSVNFGINEYQDTREQLKFSFAGCYAVAAIDSFNNQSNLTNAKCVDNCPSYTIPNVFTPNADGYNNLLNPFPYRFIDKIDITIYNRWGLEVFHTNNIDINWNGYDQKSGEKCLDGVYFYICDVFESYLEGTKKRTIRGTITIIRN